MIIKVNEQNLLLHYIGVCTVKTKSFVTKTFKWYILNGKLHIIHMNNFNEWSTQA